MRKRRDRHHHHHHYHWGGGPTEGADGSAEGDRQGYAYHAGAPGPGPNRHRLTRNTRDGVFAGVCAGIADYFGWPTAHVRIAYVLLTMFFFWMPIFAYAAMAFFLPRGEPIASRYDNPDEERFWRTYSVRPKATFSELKHRFRALDARIADMERAVTSSEFSLRREFRDLEGDA
ncbi:MAG: envelope stress response membrane protein PspC [Pseudomonadota bacterium]